MSQMHAFTARMHSTRHAHLRREAPMSVYFSMAQSFTAVIKYVDSMWIGWIEEVPGVNCQEPSREELLETLRVTLSEVLELNRQEARAAAGTDYEELSIAL